LFAVPASLYLLDVGLRRLKPPPPTQMACVRRMPTTDDDDRTCRSRQGREARASTRTPSALARRQSSSPAKSRYRLWHPMHDELI
jgi:hypothetical protein